MEIEKQKQKRRTFKTQQEREELTRIRKRNNKRDQRKREKANTEKIKNQNLKPFSTPFRQQYRRNIYLGLRHKSFNKFITLTCKDTVSLNWLVTKGKIFITEFKNTGALGNYFMVFEHEGENYHIHILNYTSNDNFLKQQIGLWRYGDTKIVDVVDQMSKEIHIKYCTKQLIADDSNPISQRLIDSWELDLISDTKKHPKQIHCSPDELIIDSQTNDKEEIDIKDSPIPQIKCSTSVSNQKKLAYRFLLWLYLIILFFSGHPPTINNY